MAVSVIVYGTTRYTVSDADALAVAAILRGPNLHGLPKTIEFTAHNGVHVVLNLRRDGIPIAVEIAAPRP